MTSDRRKKQPNRRYLAKFYTYSKDTVNSNPSVLDTGELAAVFSLFCKGLCAKEKPTKPVEVSEGARTINEQVELLLFKWTGSLAKVTHSMFCYIPQLNKVYQVNGDAFDPEGKKEDIHIYVVDNVTQDIRDKIPGALQ